MFEIELDQMSAVIWFDERDRADADQEGIGFFSHGDNVITSAEAIVIIGKYDRALKADHYKVKKNRLRSQRNSIVTAFGPEMAVRTGFR